MVYTSPLSILIMVIQLEIEDFTVYDFIALPTLLFTSIHFISHSTETIDPLSMEISGESLLQGDDLQLCVHMEPSVDGT
jgi:hypothetical protein